MQFLQNIWNSELFWNLINPLLGRQPSSTMDPSNNNINTEDNITDADTTNAINNVNGSNSITTKNTIKGGKHSNLIQKP